MGPRESGEVTGTPDPVEKGLATINTITYVSVQQHIRKPSKSRFGGLQSRVSSVACANSDDRLGVKAMVQKVRNPLERKSLSYIT